MFLSTTISLLPDWTICVQLGVFLVAAIFLTGGILRPFVRVRDLRQAATVETETATRQIEMLAADRLAEYRQRLNTAREKGLAVKEQLRQEGYAKAAVVMAEARKAALIRLDGEKARVAQEMDAARQLLTGHTAEFARSIAERILERPLSASAKRDIGQHEDYKR